MSGSNPFLQLAQRLADEAGGIARQYFGTPLDIVSKADESPVTIADRTIEQKLREIVERERPDDGILGEEFGPKETRSGYTWVFDPIDGTKSFTIARPTFGTLIGLCYKDKPILGIIDQPILGQRWVGMDGERTHFIQMAPPSPKSSPLKGEDLTREVVCRPCPSLKDAIFGTGSATQISHDDPARFDRIAAATRYTVFQGDCYFYGLMANGFIDLIVEDCLGIYDFVALVPIIEGAGGVITDWSGNPKTLHGDSTVIAAGSADIHSAARHML